MRLNSDIRKKALSGWLKNNSLDSFMSRLKLQKFLFFYETLSKMDGDESDFLYLKGYENGPVFSNVYGDYVYRRDLFISEVAETYEFKPEIVNEDRAKFSSFLTNILTERELSDLTHEMNIWSSKEEEIKSGAKHVPLFERDLTSDDFKLLEILRDAYPIEYINSIEVVEIGNKNFILEKDDFNSLTEEQQNVLLALSDNEELENPVYVKIAEDGVLLVD